MAGILKRALGFLIGVDEAFNALGGGDPKETISGTIGRAEARGAWWGKFAARALDSVMGPNHSANAAASEGKARGDANNGDPPY